MVIDDKQYEIYRLTLDDGTCPINEWLEDLDKVTRLRIERRIGRIEIGNFGDWKNVGEGVFELRLHFGAGYRAYYAKEGNRLVILLGGGSKRSQKKDIKRAKELWEKYKSETYTI